MSRRTETSLEELRQRAWATAGKLRDAEEEARNKIGRPLLRKQVGKCFVYSNSYGSGERWPLYARIVNFNEKDMTFEAVEFQNTSMNRIEIHYHCRYNFERQSSFSVQSGWRPITVTEYNRRKRALLRLVDRLLERRPKR